MRITINIKNSLGEHIKTIAQKNKKSVSSFISESLEEYIEKSKKNKAMKEILNMAGKINISDEILDELERERDEADHNRL